MSIELCPRCGKEFESVVKRKDRHTYIRRFCSRNCANSHVCSDAHRKKASDINKKLFADGKLFIPIRTGKVGRQRRKWGEFTCQECGARFEDYKNRPHKYCSSKCCRKNMGGYRQGSGRSKSGYYKGVYCGSTYELVWVIYRLDHNLPVNRFQGVLCCKQTGKKYIPDFVDGNVIFEIKGYEWNDTGVKIKIAESHGFNVKIIRKQDLEKEFEWVNEKYKTKKYETLYDDYKGFVCGWCGKCFSGSTKTKNVFCSRSCCGKYMANRKGK